MSKEDREEFTEDVSQKLAFKRAFGSKKSPVDAAGLIELLDICDEHGARAEPEIPIYIFRYHVFTVRPNAKTFDLHPLDEDIADSPAYKALNQYFIDKGYTRRNPGEHQD